LAPTQPWCNGRVGTFGLSYAAHTQAALGCLDPPGPAAQFLDCGGFSNAYRSGIRHGGAFDLKQATWAYRNALADARDVNPNSGEPEGTWQQPRIARNRVFVEAARPSHLLLPVIPRNGTNGMERERSSP
jgi:predicted acyl esterase